MTDNKELYPQQPEPAGQTPSSGTASPETAVETGASSSAPSNQATQQPAPNNPAPGAVAPEKPVPQLTLEPDPAPPTITFPEPPAAPEPPPEPVVQQQGNVQYNQYSYTSQQIHQDQPFNQQPYGQDQGYQQPQYTGQNNGYRAPNFTAQSYQPPVQPQQPKYTTPPAGYLQKSRLAAGLLAFLLGGLGIHNFYMGMNTRGTVQLVLCLAGGLLTCGVASVAAVIWGLIEGVMILSENGPKFDGNGVIMKD